MAFVAGQRLRASQLNEQGTLVARAARTSNTASSTSAVVGILRLDDVPVIQGRAYEFRATGGLFPLGAGTSRADMTLRYTTDGSTPLITSPILKLTGRQMFVDGFVEPYDNRIIYVPPLNQTISLLACYQSVVYGVAVASYGAANWPTEITIVDLGADPGDTGVDI